MTPRVTRRSLLAGAAVLALSACAPPYVVAPASPSPARRGTQRLLLSWWTDTGYPSPFTFSSVGPGGVVKLMLLFDTLTWKDERGIIPWLARSWTIEEGGLAYRFELRDDVTFSDGKPLTAKDVAFTFEYFARFPFKWSPSSVVAGVEALGERAVRIRLRQPFAPFLEDVAGAIPILPAHVWSAVSDPLKFTDPAAVIGSGPYTLVSYAGEKGEYLFRARDRHFAGTPLVRELAYVLIPPAQRAIALQKREADTFLSTEYDIVPAFGNGDPYRIFTTQAFSIARLILNVDRAPFTDKRVRQAVAYALDRKDIAERVTHAPDVIVGSAGVIPPESPWFASGLPQYPHDPAQAKRLLDEAGLIDRDGDGLRELPDGKALTIDLLADPASPDAPIIIAQLRTVGLAVRLVGGDPKTRTDLQAKRQFALAFATHIGVGGDPDFLRRWFAGEVFNAFESGNALHSPDFDLLAAAQVREMDIAKRRDLVARMQGVLADELPTLPLYHRRFYFVYDPAKWDGWSNTWGGIMTGIPLLENKIAFLAR